MTAPSPSQLIKCSCGEENDIREWRWEKPAESDGIWVVLSQNDLLVTFHPVYSAGTAAVRGDMPMSHNYHYYWEVKMLTDTYGTDIMVGVGTEKVNIIENRHKFMSLLGTDPESYGLSYSGQIRHNSQIVNNDSNGFCKGSIIGIRLDMWKGTLEFYINRKSQGIAFYNLRRHKVLYPMVSSTAAQSAVKIVYAASWQASLMVDSLKILSASVTRESLMRLPPGLCNRLKNQFWLTMPSEDSICNSDSEPVRKKPNRSGNVLGETFPLVYINGFYADHVDRDYRLVLWEEPPLD